MVRTITGLHRAQEAAEDGEPWGEELVRRYQEARDRYAARWHVARE